MAGVLVAVAAIASAMNVALLRTFRGFPSRTFDADHAWLAWAVAGVVVATTIAVIVVAARRNADSDPPPTSRSEKSGIDAPVNNPGDRQVDPRALIVIMLALALFGVVMASAIARRPARARPPRVTPSSVSSTQPQG